MNHTEVFFIFIAFIASLGVLAMIAEKVLDCIKCYIFRKEIINEFEREIKRNIERCAKEPNKNHGERNS